MRNNTPDSKIWSYTRKFFVLIVGMLVTIVGIVMIVTPGPALLLIPTGLAILAWEFDWAKDLLEKCKSYIARKNKT